MTTPTYRQPPQELPDLPESPDSCIERAKQLCARHKQVTEILIADVDSKNATFQNFALPVAHLQNDWYREMSLMAFWNYVHPDAAFRNASTQAMQILQAGTGEPSIEEHIKAIYEKAEELDPESQKFLQDKWNDYLEPHSNRLSEIGHRIREICTEFNKNLSDENGGLWFSEGELAGVPSGWIGCFEKGSGAYDGKYRVPFKGSLCQVILALAIDPDVRKRVWLGRENSCAKNASLFKEVIVLRHEQATLSGYPNYAVYAQENALLKGPGVVRNLLEKFHKKVAPGHDLEILAEAKRVDPKAIGETIYHWDELYYRRIWKANQPDEASEWESPDAQKPQFRHYFPFQSTIAKMLGIFGDLFGLEFEKIDGKTWHKDVDVYSVWDDEENGGAFSGYLYLDCYPRSGKSPGCFSLQVQPSYLRRNGERSYTATTLVCNIDGLEFGIPHSDLLVLFHELGHSMHALVSRTKYALFHGHNNSGDFVEVPSVMLEHWCFTPGPLKRMSAHRETGEPVPENFISQVMRTQYCTRIHTQFQVALAAFDQAIYGPASQQEIEEMDVAKLYSDILYQKTGFTGVESDWPHGYSKRNHQMSSTPGTSYVYIAGVSLAELIWKSIFAEDPMSREAGMRYRRIVLEPGGSQDPLDMLEKLLGKRPKVEDLCN